MINVLFNRDRFITTYWGFAFLDSLMWDIKIPESKGTRIAFIILFGFVYEYY